VTPPPAADPVDRLDHESRNLLHIVHGASAVGWFGAATLIAFLAVTATSTNDHTLAHALYQAIDTSLPVTLTFGILALSTGVALGLNTEWGILGYWWVSTKLVIALAVLLADVLVVHNATNTALHTASPPVALVGAAVGHPIALALAAILAIYKPWGRTPLEASELPGHQTAREPEIRRSAQPLEQPCGPVITALNFHLERAIGMLNLKIHKDANQRELAGAVGVSGPTLTQHLNATEKDGLLARRRDPSSRRNHIIELTTTGEAAFTRLAAKALAFDQQLRTNLEPADLDTLRALLDQLSRNVGAGQTGPPWAGLIEATADRTPRKRTRTPTRDPERQS